MYQLKDLVKEECKLTMIRNTDDGMAAIYETASGFKFPIPIAEMQDGTFNATERGGTLMKWINRAVKSINTDDVTS